MNVTEYRNIAEQVQKNKEDILLHFQKDRVLADFGITVIGQVDTVDELPANGGQYGNAYAVGPEAPFDYYIWTRANNISDVDYWFNFGKITIAGPQGPKGDKGDKGETGTSTEWLYGNVTPYKEATEGSFYLNTSNGEVFVRSDLSWIYIGNIRGRQGIQGPVGPKGDQGPVGPAGIQGPQGSPAGIVKINGILTSPTLLPEPATLNDLTLAYLVGSPSVYILYVQAGDSPSTAIWVNAGQFNAGTAVYNNGEFVNTYDMQNKVDKTTESGTRAYVSINGVNTTRAISNSAVANTLAIRDTGGTFKVGEPTHKEHPATKNYVDTELLKSGVKLPLIGGYAAYSLKQDSDIENECQGVGSVVFGDNNHVRDLGSYYTIAGGVANEITSTTHSFIMGEENIVTNVSDGIVVGNDLIATDDIKAVFGKYNEGNNNSILEIGNGSASSRWNAFTVTADGGVYGGRPTTNADQPNILVTKEYSDRNKTYEYEKFVGTGNWFTILDRTDPENPTNNLDINRVMFEGWIHHTLGNEDVAHRFCFDITKMVQSAMPTYEFYCGIMADESSSYNRNVSYVIKLDLRNPDGEGTVYEGLISSVIVGYTDEATKTSQKGYVSNPSFRTILTADITVL